MIEHIRELIYPQLSRGASPFTYQVWSAFRGVLPFISGTLTADADGWPRTTLTVEVADHLGAYWLTNPEGAGVLSPQDALRTPSVVGQRLPFGSELMIYAAGAPLAWQLPVTGAAYDQGQRTWTVTAADFSSTVHLAKWHEPITPSGATSPSQWVRDVVGGGAPPFTDFVYDIAPAFDERPLPAEGKLAVSDSRWESVEELVSGRDMEVFFDPFGSDGGVPNRLVVREIREPNVEDAVDVLQVGVNVVTAAAAVNGGFNDVQIRFTNTLGELGVLGVWVDWRDGSPTNVDVVGHRVYVVDRRGSPTQAQADRAAARLARRVRGRLFERSYTTTPMPWLVPGDSVWVDDWPYNAPADRCCIVTRVEHDLRGGPSVVTVADQKVGGAV